MILRPLKDKIVILQIEKETVTSSGIVLTSVDREAQTEGRVVAIGPDVSEVKPDDRVIVDWSKSARAGKHWIIREQDVVAVLEE
jgi:co-chaperonin GroES (HSP10)